MFYVTRGLFDSAIISSEKPEDDIPFFEFDTLPDNIVGALKIDKDGNLYMDNPSDEFLQNGGEAIDPAQEIKMLKAQLQATNDRAEFIEDCIAEMAMQVYSL